MEALIRAILVRLAAPANSTNVHDLGSNPGGAKAWFRSAIEPAMGGEYGEAADKLVDTLQKHTDLSSRLWTELTSPSAAIIGEVVLAACPAPQRREQREESRREEPRREPERREERREESRRESQQGMSLENVIHALNVLFASSHKDYTAERQKHEGFQSIVRALAHQVVNVDLDYGEALKRIAERYKDFDFERGRSIQRAEAAQTQAQQGQTDHQRLQQRAEEAANRS